MQSLTFWRNKHPNSHGILLWSAQRLLWGLKCGFIFTPVYQPDCSSDSQSDLHHRVFIFCSVDCWLEFTKIYFTTWTYCNREERAKGQRQPETLASAEWHESWPECKHMFYLPHGLISHWEHFRCRALCLPDIVELLRLGFCHNFSWFLRFYCGYSLCFMCMYC